VSGGLCPWTPTDEEPDSTWSCPFCGCPHPPREEPKGVYCRHCLGKLETCCEGAALPPRSS
jgi:hypothetical protein